MTDLFSYPSRRIWPPAILLVVVAVLAACGGEQTPTINPENTLSITRADGAATLVRAVGGSEDQLPESFLMAPGDQLYTVPNQTSTLQFSDGSTLQLGSDSHLLLFSIRPQDHVAVFRLLSGTTVGDLHSNLFEMQAYEEQALNFHMVQTDLTAAPSSVAGTYQLGFDGSLLKAVVSAGEVNVRSGNQQATLPAGWQAIVEPNKPLQVASLITPSPAPPSATEAPTSTPIPIILITLTSIPSETPLATDTATATFTPTGTPTRIQRTITTNIPTDVPTDVSTVAVDTPVPTAPPKPNRPPKPTNPPQPTNPPPPPPTNPPPPPPTNPPPTKPPTPRPTL